jgi:hypothetical protein
MLVKHLDEYGADLHHGDKVKYLRKVYNSVIMK